MEDIMLATQVFLFGVVVAARLHLTSQLARKRILGFYLSMFAGFLFSIIMIYQGLLVLAAMQLLIFTLDIRGIVNNKRNLNQNTGERYAN